MNIVEIIENDKITVRISGEIDGSNVNEVETTLKASSEKSSNLVIDLKELEYISSAGLRVFLIIRKLTESAGHKMILKNVTEDVMEIFTVTGFVNLLTIEA
ncbi:MAG: STAS domain-containing protein [Lachnospiraceae bacterium]|nr:STAS domain-containing protein [Lachnospiraceae bacterium]